MRWGIPNFDRCVRICETEPTHMVPGIVDDGATRLAVVGRRLMNEMYPE